MKHRTSIVFVFAILFFSLPVFCQSQIESEWEVARDGATAFLTFYKDKTFFEIDKTDLGEILRSKGTFEGDTTKDGTICMIVTSIVWNGEELLSAPTKLYCVVKGDLLDGTNPMYRVKK